MVNASDSQSGSPGFESRSGHLLDLLSGRSEFKSSVTLVNSQLVASWGFKSCYVVFELFVSKYSSGVPVN